MELSGLNMKKIVRELRGEISQAKLAQLTGISQAAIAQYELGRMPKPEILERIAAAVGKQIIWKIEDMTSETDLNN